MKSAAVGDMNEAALGECAMSHIMLTNACPCIRCWRRINISNNSMNLLTCWCWKFKSCCLIETLFERLQESTELGASMQTGPKLWFKVMNLFNFINTFVRILFFQKQDISAPRAAPNSMIRLWLKILVLKDHTRCFKIPAYNSVIYKWVSICIQNNLITWMLLWKLWDKIIVLCTNLFTF